MIEHIDMTIKSKIDDKLAHTKVAQPAPALVGPVMGKKDVALDYHNKVVKSTEIKIDSTKSIAENVAFSLHKDID